VHWVIYFCHAYPYSSEKFFDLAGQIAFSTMALLSLYGSIQNQRQVIVTVCCGLWSVRLGGFLFSRMLERKHDFRFVKARKYPGYCFFAWTCQGLWCFPVGLPLLQLHTQNSAPAWDYSVCDCVGLLTFAAGLVLEAIADRQKLQFVRTRARAPHGQQWIDTGVWKYSRHPNFFGEVLIWVGVCVMCLPGCDSWVAMAAAASSPVFSAVFLMQTSLPWLEAVADRKYGQDEGYRRYKHQTSVFVPLAPRTAEMRGAGDRSRSDEDKNGGI